MNEVANNYLTHEEIQKGNAAMKDCAARGGDVSACQKKVVSALQALDIARDKELLEAQRIAELAEYQIHWGCKSDTACIDQYRGVQVKAENMLNTVRLLDRNGAITFDGYHPSIKIDSLLALDGAVNQSQQTYKKVSEYLAENGIGGALSDAANGLANVIPATVAGAKDFITAPIPAHILAQTLDNMTLLTAQSSGALAFDVTSGMALSYVGGKVMGWTLEKGWQALSGTAAEMAETYLKKQGLIPAVVPEGNSTPKLATSFGKIPEQITTSSGIAIKATPGKTTTILGSYAVDMDNIINGQLAYPKNTDFGGKPGGFNALNVPNEMYKTAEQFWNEVNKPFLDAAIGRGDDIALATKPTVDVLYRDDKSLTGFGREIKYLIDNGYHYDSLISKMVKN